MLHAGIELRFAASHDAAAIAPALTITSVDSTILASTDQPGPVDLANVRVRMFSVDEIRRILV